MASFCLELETEAVKTCLHSSTEGKEIMVQKVKKPWKRLEIYSYLHILFYFLAMRGCF